MKKQLTLFSVCLAGICMLQLHSCIKPPPGFDPEEAGNVYTGCRIKKTATVGQYNSFNRYFVYNSNNDPVSVYGDGGPGQGGTGSPALSFLYDKKHRLTEYSGPYGNGYYEFLHRYKYEKDRIVVDSEYNFGPVAGPLPAKAAYHYFRYDKFDRITQDSIVFINLTGGPIINNYNYDQNGNLAGVSKLYDNKLNPHRTNRIWMFIDRNYSLNNPVTAGTYNSSGLPLHFDFLNASFIGSYYLGVTDIAYECK